MKYGILMGALPAILITTSMAFAATTVDATPFIDRTLADCGIQKAINSLPEEGGVVELPEGEFVLERYLFLKSGTILRGKGAKTILRVGKPEARRDITKDCIKSAEIEVAGDLSGLKPGMIVHAWRFRTTDYLGYIRHYRVKEIRDQTVVLDKQSKYNLELRNKAQISWGMFTALAAPAKKGENTIRVEHPDLLKPGYAICFSGKGDLWNHHFNVVTAIEGDTCTLERALTVDSDTGTLVKHAHCIITSDGQKNIGMEDLVIRGWESKEKPAWGGFRLAGFHAVRCENITLKNIEISDWNGDGISIQVGREARVENCCVHKCNGRGFHPGTGFTNTEFVNLKSIGNGGEGSDYCWHNKNVNLRNSIIRDNGHHGVGGLGNPGDRNCTVEGNRITGNARAGIGINGGMVSGSVIRNNIVRDNSRSKPGAYAGIAIYAVAEDARNYTIEGNIVESTLENPTQWIGIEERNGKPVSREVKKRGKTITVTKIADENRIVRNKCSGHKTADILVIGAKTVAEDNEGAVVRKTEEKAEPAAP